MKTLKEFLNIEDAIHVAKEQIANDIETFINDEDVKVTYVCEIISGATGQYQLTLMAELIGLVEEDYERNGDRKLFPMESINEVENAYRALADELTELSGLSGSFYFGNFEADNSFGLFYTEK